MADLDPVIAEADWGALAGAVNGLGRQRALVVLLTPLEPSAVEEGLLPVLAALTRHHRVVLASVRDPELEQLTDIRETLDEVYDAAAAEQAIGRRRHTAGMLRTLGVDVVDADDLPPVLADHYLALKAAASSERLSRDFWPRESGLSVIAVPTQRSELPTQVVRTPDSTCQAWVATRSSSRAASRSPVWPRRKALRPSTKT